MVVLMSGSPRLDDTKSGVKKVFTNFFLVCLLLFMSSASVEELRDALRENLEHSGQMREVKAKIRAAIYSALSDDGPVSSYPYKFAQHQRTHPHLLFSAAQVSGSALRRQFDPA
jgi:hypothetical protein